MARWRFWRRPDEEHLLSRIQGLFASPGALADPQSFERFGHEGYRLNAVVRACVLEIATSVAEPQLVVEERPQGKEWRAVSPTDPLQRLLDKPNREQTQYDFLEEMLIHFQTFGNQYTHMLRSMGGVPVEIWNLKPHRVKIILGKDGFAAQYEFKKSDIEKPKIPAADISHMKMSDPLDDHYGLPPLLGAARAADMDDRALDYMRAFFTNAGTPHGIMNLKGRSRPEQRLRIKEDWRSENSGKGGWHSLSVLDGDVTYQEVGTRPDKLKLDSIFDVTESRVCTVFQVPPILIAVRIGLMRSTFCLPGSARVWTPSGPVRMDEVKEGQEVWSFTGSGLEPRKVTKSGCTGSKLLYEIRTKNRVLRASGNHPILVRRPGHSKVRNNERRVGLHWLRVDELQPGDFVVQPKALPDGESDRLPDGQQATSELLQFLGAVIGDGTVSKPGVRMAMPPGTECSTAYQALAKKLFWKRPYGQREDIFVQTRERDFGFSSTEVAKWLIELGFGGRARTKRIPSWVWSLRRELRLAFLAGLVDSDGSVDSRGALQFGFANRELTLDVRDLLISVGIQCSNLYEATIPVENLPNPGLQEEYKAWQFVASSAVRVAEIPFVDSRYRKRVNDNPHRFKKDGRDSAKAGLDETLGFYQVVSVDTLWEEAVYDIEVEGNHSFVADGVVVHNSNYREARTSFWRETLVPMYKRVGDRLTHALVPEFQRDGGRELRVRFDLSEIEDLQESLDSRRTYARNAWNDGLATRNEARELVRLEQLPPEVGNVFKRRLNEEVEDATRPSAPAGPARRPAASRGVVPEGDEQDSSEPGLKVVQEGS